jgi:hypothetical protein
VHSATRESGVLENKEVLDQLGKLKEEYNIRMVLPPAEPIKRKLSEKGT